MNRPDGGERVWRRANEKYHNGCSEVWWRWSDVLGMQGAGPLVRYKLGWLLSSLLVKIGTVAGLRLIRGGFSESGIAVGALLTFVGRGGLTNPHCYSYYFR